MNYEPLSMNQFELSTQDSRPGLKPTPVPYAGNYNTSKIKPVR